MSNSVLDAFERKDYEIARLRRNEDLQMRRAIKAQAENEQLRAIMADALRIMECVPRSLNDHRPIEDVRKDMRTVLEQQGDRT